MDETSCWGVAATTPLIYLLGGVAQASVRKCWSWSSLLGWLLQGLLPPYGWPRPCSLPRGNSRLDQSNDSNYTALHVTPLPPAWLYRCCFSKFLKTWAIAERWKRSRVTCKEVNLDAPTFLHALFPSWYLIWEILVSEVFFFCTWMQKHSTCNNWQMDRMLYLWPYLPQYSHHHVGDAISSCFTFQGSALTFQMCFQQWFQWSCTNICMPFVPKSNKRG